MSRDQVRNIDSVIATQPKLILDRHYETIGDKRKLAE